MSNNSDSQSEESKVGLRLFISLMIFAGGILWIIAFTFDWVATILLFTGMICIGYYGGRLGYLRKNKQQKGDSVS